MTAGAAMTIPGISFFLFLGVTGIVLISSSFLALPEKFRKTSLPLLLSFATGSLLATALIVNIPDTARQMGMLRSMYWVVGGLIGFIALEKLIHLSTSTQSEPGVPRAAAPIILFGSSTHSFVDGIIIASAFSFSWELGVATATGILIHEIPQKVGDLAVLLQSGFENRRAFIYNYMAALPAIPAGILTFYFLSELRYLSPYFTCVSAASLLYVSLADLVPTLQKQSDRVRSILYLFFMIAGVVAIYLIRR